MQFVNFGEWLAYQYANNTEFAQFIKAYPDASDAQIIAWIKPWMEAHPDGASQDDRMYMMYYLGRPNMRKLHAPVQEIQQPPQPPPQRNIPPNSDDIVYAMPITEGMNMVDFHGEYGYGRYYPVELYNALRLPKLNPMTRRPILPAEVQYYTAHIDPPGGRRRKTRKSNRRARTTRVLGTRKSRRRYT